MTIRRPRPGSGCLWCLGFLGFDFEADDGAGTLGADGWEGAAGMISPDLHVESASMASWASAAVDKAAHEASTVILHPH
jgi:hypothetical protein